MHLPFDCNPDGGSENIRRGMAVLSVAGDTLQLRDTIYDDRVDRICIEPKLIGASTKDDNLITLDRDERHLSFAPKPYILNWYNKDLDRIASYTLRYDWWQMYDKNNGLLIRDSSLLLFGSVRKDFPHAAFFEVSYSGDSIRLMELKDQPITSSEVLINTPDYMIVRVGKLLSEQKFLIKLDHALNEVWRVEFNGKTNLNFSGRALLLPDGGFLLPHNRHNISRFDKDGQLVATKIYDARIDLNFTELALLDDQHFMVFGTIDTFYTDRSNFVPCERMFLLEDALSNLTPVSVDAPQPNHHSVHLYPNPASDIIKLKLRVETDKNLSYKIFNMLGQQVMYSNRLSRQVAISHLPKGIYFLQLFENEVPIETLQFVKQ